MDSAYFLRLANTLCDRMSDMRAKQCVNYASSAWRDYAKAITRSVTNISLKNNPPGLKHFFFKGCYYANDMNGMM